MAVHAWQVMLAGELRCCTVRLTNSGSGALANLRLAVASPDVFCGVQSPDDAAKALRAEPVQVESFRDGQALYALGPGARLAPGESLRWPLWLHPRAAGELAFHYVWHYEPEEPVDGMRYRCGAASVCRYWSSAPLRCYVFRNPSFWSCRQCDMCSAQEI